MNMAKKDDNFMSQAPHELPLHQIWLKQFMNLSRFRNVKSIVFINQFSSSIVNSDFISL